MSSKHSSKLSLNDNELDQLWSNTNTSSTVSTLPLSYSTDSINVSTNQSLLSPSNNILNNNTLNPEQQAKRARREALIKQKLEERKRASNESMSGDTNNRHSNDNNNDRVNSMDTNVSASVTPINSIQSKSDSKSYNTHPPLIDSNNNNDGASSSIIKSSNTISPLHTSTSQSSIPEDKPTANHDRPSSSRLNIIHHDLIVSPTRNDKSKSTTIKYAPGDIRNMQSQSLPSHYSPHKSITIRPTISLVKSTSIHHNTATTERTRSSRTTVGSTVVIPANDIRASSSTHHRHSSYNRDYKRSRSADRYRNDSRDRRAERHHDRYDDRRR